MEMKVQDDIGLCYIPFFFHSCRFLLIGVNTPRRK